jgi:hypothetical protein
LYGEQKGENALKHFPTRENMPICIENYFLFLQALSRFFPTYIFNYSIFDEFILNKL